MRHGKIKGLVLAVAVLAGTVGLVAPNAGAVDCGTTIKIDNAQETEGEVIEFPVTVSANPTCHTTGSVSYETATMISEHPAEPGKDYDPAGGNLQWDKPLGAASRTVYAKVDSIEDGHLEFNEEFRVQIFDAHGATISARPATGTITDDDTPVIDLNPDSTGGTGDCIICPEGRCEISVGPQSPSTHSITVGYATIDGTARAGEDFTGVRDGRLTIPAGATMGRFTIEILRNTPGEPFEQFYVVLTSVSAGSIGRGRLEVHILVTR